MNIKGNHDWNRNNNFCDSVELEIFLSGLKIQLDHFLNLKIKDKHYAKDSFKVIEIKDRGCISKKKVFLKLQIPIYLNGQIIQKKEEFQLLNHIKSYKFIRVVRRLFNEDKIEIWTR